MDEKCFCSDCGIFYNRFFISRCAMPKNKYYKYTYRERIRKYKIFPRPSAKNKNNNCKDYVGKYNNYHS